MSMQNTFQQRYSAFISIVVFLMSANVLSVPAQAEECKVAQAEAVQKLFRELERNEALYANLKMTATSTHIYENFPSLDEAFKPVLSKTEYSLLARGKKYRKQYKSTGRFIVIMPTFPKDINNPGKSSYTATGSTESIDAFDGKTLRKFFKRDMSAEGKRIDKWASSNGDVSEEPPGLVNKASLHTFHIQNSKRKVSLSSCLKEVESLPAFPVSFPMFKEVIQIRIADVRIVGTEAFQGQQCTKIVIETVDPEGAPYSREELWLAQDRNYIPIRRLYFHYKDSKILPNREFIVDTWQEVRPGVWYPVKSHSNRFSSLTLRHEGRQRLASRTKREIKSVQLNPQISPEVFSQVEFPPGTAVYRVIDGKRSLIKKITIKQN